MTSAKVCIMIAIIIYLGSMLYIGYMCSRKNESTDDIRSPPLSRRFTT